MLTVCKEEKVLQVLWRSGDKQAPLKERADHILHVKQLLTTDYLILEEVHCGQRMVKKGLKLEQ